MVNARNIMVLLVVTLLFSFTEPVNEVKWHTIEEAQKMIVNEPKPIFIDFTADWCGWCKVMDKNTFSDQEVATYMNENFYAVRLDYDSQEKFEFFGEKYTARQLGAKYRVPGLPTILLITPDNKKSKKVIGYKKPDLFLNNLKSFIK